MTDRVVNPLRVEFWQTLARALVVPRGSDFFAAMREDLTDDLDDLGHELGLDLGNTLHEFSRAALQLVDEETLLVAYSRLFLTPPIPCRLTLGWYLDGTVMGPSEQYLGDLMAHHGVAQIPDLGESKDVLPTVLELLALLLQRLDESEDAARRASLEKDIAILCTHCLGPSLRQMVELAAQAEEHYALVPVYSRLLKIVVAALDDPQERFFVPLEADAKKAPPRFFAKRESSADLVTCAACGKLIATARELRVVIHRLTQDGLPADHLTLCPDCREVEMGWKSGSSKLHIPGMH